MFPIITVTGIDEKIDIDMLKGLNAEIGILYTATPEGRNRYPKKTWVEATVSYLKFQQVALHVCGSGARKELLQGDLDKILENVNRVQVNGILSIEECETVCRAHNEKRIITQHKPETEHLLSVTAQNHEILVDASGGRGILPKIWQPPNTQKNIGYAGGLGPENIARELCKIKSIATGNWWVDMEEGLRINDWFSMERAQAAICAFWDSLK